MHKNENTIEQNITMRFRKKKVHAVLFNKGAGVAKFDRLLLAVYWNARKFHYVRFLFCCAILKYFLLEIIFHIIFKWWKIENTTFQLWGHRHSIHSAVKHGNAIKIENSSIRIWATAAIYRVVALTFYFYGLTDWRTDSLADDSVKCVGIECDRK